MKISYLLTALVFIGMVTVWATDGCFIKNFIQSWRLKQEYLGRKFNSQPLEPTNKTQQLPIPQPSYNSVSSQNYADGFLQKDSEAEVKTNSNNVPVEISSMEKESERNVKWVSTSLEPNSNNVPVEISSMEKESERNVKWVSTSLEPDLISNLLSRWLAPGGEPCKDSRTVDIVIPGLDGHDSIELTTGKSHEFVFQAVDESKNPLCFGGDYFEIDLSGESWKSRPLLRDFGNGSYSISLQVHPDFAGNFNLTAFMLFRHFEGLERFPQRFAYNRELRKVQIKFVKANYQLPQLKICDGSDFDKDLWVGRWTRHGKNDDCEISEDGRYRCLPSDFPCQSPWCVGSLGLIESNGWVYSSHCSFRLFSADSAWNCLKNRWIFFWGDSNHVDTIRNMLNFILNLPEIKAVPRRFDMNFSNPKDASQSVRITSIFNGHWKEALAGKGLNSLKDERFRNLSMKYFSEETVPDTIIMNSGLHDGIFWPHIRNFSGGVDYAVSFWKGVMDSVKQRGMVPPQIIYRITIAAGGYAREKPYNPSKMEAFNWLVLEKFRQAGRQ